MPVCERHGIFTKGDEICGQCWREGALAKVAEKKSAKGKPTQRKALKDKAQSLYSKLMKTKLCGDKKFVNCSTCGKSIQAKGSNIVNTAHVGHYFPKSIYWGLAYDIVNGNLQCYKCNVLDQAAIPAMRNSLVKLHGEDKIKDLEQRAEDFLIKVKSGQLKSQPDEIWLIGMIEEMKRKK